MYHLQFHTLQGLVGSSPKSASLVRHHGLLPQYTAGASIRVLVSNNGPLIIIPIPPKDLHVSMPTWSPFTADAWNRVRSAPICYIRSHCSPTSRIKLHFKDSKGNLIKTVEANEGDDVLSIAHEHDIDLEGTLGFANGSELRCSRWTIPFRCLRRICRMLDLSHNPRSRVIRSSAGTRGKPAIRSLFAC